VKVISKQFGAYYNHTLLNMGSKVIGPEQTQKFSGSIDAFNYPAEIQVKYDNCTLTKEIIIEEQEKQVFEFKITYSED